MLLPNPRLPALWNEAPPIKLMRCLAPRYPHRESSLAEMPDPRASESLEAAEKAVRMRPWSALTYPQFRLFWGSFLFGNMGTQMRLLTNLWVIYELTQSPFQLGLLGLAMFAPQLLLGLVGGFFADAVDRKKLLMFTLWGNVLVASALSALYISGFIQVWHVYTASVFTGAIQTFNGPARNALIPALLPRTHLQNAYALNTTSQQGSQFIGPTLGGFIIAWGGAGAAYLTNALGFLPVIVALMFLRVPPARQELKIRQVNLGQMLAGLRFIGATRLILGLVIMDTVVMTFTSYRALMPIFAVDVLGVGSEGLGLLLAAPSVGFLMGSLVILSLGNIQRKGLTVVLSFAGYASAIFLFSLSQSFALSLFAIALVGGMDAIGTILRQTTLQIMVPDEIRGRATSVLQVSAGGSNNLGYFVTGSIAAALGAPGALMAGAVVCIVVVSSVAIGWRRVMLARTQ